MVVASLVKCQLFMHFSAEIQKDDVRCKKLMKCLQLLEDNSKWQDIDLVMKEELSIIKFPMSVANQLGNAGTYTITDLLCRSAWKVKYFITKNVLRFNLREHKFSKFYRGGMSSDPLVLACYICLYAVSVWLLSVSINKLLVYTFTVLKNYSYISQLDTQLSL